MKNEIIDKLKEAGIKVTPQRVEILKCLEDQMDHLTAEEIFTKVKKIFPAVSFATIYNTLEKLEQLGLIKKLKISSDNAVNYEYNMMPHYHFFCKKCKRIFDVKIKLNIEDIKDVGGNKVDEIHGYLKGICRDCRAI